MSVIIDWAAQVWDLLLTLGWWITAGLVLSTAIQIVPLVGQNGRLKGIPVLLAIICGILLPVCNFAVIPLAAVLWFRGMGMGVSFAFLSAATLLNPAGILSAWAYMGPVLTIAYILCAVAVSTAAGASGMCIGAPMEKALHDATLKNRICRIWGKFGPDLALWVLLGIVAEGLLLALTPDNLWQNLLLNPAEASFAEAAAAGLFRHVCIPDDVTLAASLVATGLRPGCAVLFLLMGVCTNLPELFVLCGMAGKKAAGLYLCVTAAVSTGMAVLTELVMGDSFVPQFNLANAETYTRIANLLSIRTWMPAKTPCALILLLLAGMGLWRYRNNVFFNPDKKMG